MSFPTPEIVKTAAAAAGAGMVAEFVPPDLWALPWLKLLAGIAIALIGGLTHTAMDIRNGKRKTWQFFGWDMVLAGGAGFLGFLCLAALHVENQFVYGPVLFLAGFGGASFILLLWDGLVIAIKTRMGVKP